MSDDLPDVSWWIVDQSSWTMGQGQRGVRYIRLPDPDDKEGRG